MVMKLIKHQTRPLLTFLTYYEKMDKDAWLRRVRHGDQEDEGMWVEYDFDLDGGLVHVYEIEKLFPYYTSEELLAEDGCGFDDFYLVVCVSEFAFDVGVSIEGSWYDLPEYAFYNYLKTLVGETDYVFEDDEMDTAEQR